MEDPGKLHINCCSGVSNEPHPGIRDGLEDHWKKTKQKKLLDLNISKSSYFYIAECFSFQSLSYWNLYWWDQYVWTLSQPIMIHIWWRLEIAVILHEQRMPRECWSFSSEGADSPQQLSTPFTKVYGAGAVIGSGGIRENILTLSGM